MQGDGIIATIACYPSKPLDAAMTKTSIKIFGTIAWILLFLKTDSAHGQVIWDRAQIDRVRQQQVSGNKTYATEIAKLQSSADQALGEPLLSVTHKKMMPPSDDIHDYLSFSRYWWPDPDKPDGLPYIRKDGVVNRKLIANGDRNRLGQFCERVETLTLAGYVLDDSRYSQRAAQLVRTWFLDESTRMNPNLNFGQGVPGRESGRGPGIIDTRGFMLVLDGVELLDESTWSAEDKTGLQAWFDDYQNWLKDSPLGQHEQRAENNHGAWYAAQRARYALYAGQEDIAKEIVSGARQRIADQFDAEGNQAAENKRTLSLHYNLFNLTALSRLARVGDQVEEDLWDYVPKDGCGIRQALTHLLPYLVKQSDWPHEQIKSVSLSPSSHLTLRLFSQHFDDPSYRDVVPKLEMRYADRDFSKLQVGDSRESR